MRAPAVILMTLVAACSDDPAAPPAPKPIVTQADLDGPGWTEVMPCRIASHNHDLHNVRTVANALGADLYTRCVLDPGQHCTGAFPTGAIFVKYEYDPPACDPADLIEYTVSEKLDAGTYAPGHDWRWQILTPRLKVTDDGAPMRCLLCHIDHCPPPYGLDLRCLPD